MLELGNHTPKMGGKVGGLLGIGATRAALVIATLAAGKGLRADNRLQDKESQKEGKKQQDKEIYVSMQPRKGK